jgi:hypothetical protein
VQKWVLDHESSKTSICGLNLRSSSPSCTNSLCNGHISMNPNMQSELGLGLDVRLEVHFSMHVNTIGREGSEMLEVGGAE